MSDQHHTHNNTTDADEEPIYETPGAGYPPPPDVLDTMGTLGSTILNKVNDAVSAADFAGLSSTVSSAIKATTDSISRSLTRTSPYIISSSSKKTTALVKRISFGWLSIMDGLITFAGLIALTESFSSHSSSLTYLIMLIIFGSLTMVFGTNWSKARTDHKMHKALEQFSRAAGNREQVSIEELASRTGYSFDDVITQLNHGIEKSFIPHGRIRTTTNGNTMLYLTDHAFEAAGGHDEKKTHFTTSERIAQRQQTNPTSEPASDNTQQSAQQNAANQSTSNQSTSGDPRVAHIISEGSAYIERIHRANEVIIESEMSDKLDHLESIVRRIIAGVQERPETAAQLGQFMNYYLPTTGKLVDAYADLDAHGEHGPNAEATRKEIKGTLDVINDSFDKLADDLLQDTAWDLQSDMHVLRTMLRQDGLTDDGGPRADENHKNSSV